MKQPKEESITKHDLYILRRDIQDDIHKLEISLIKMINDGQFKVIGIMGGIQALILGIFGISQYLLK